MPDATLRQVGGSVMVAIPPALLEQLNLSARSIVGIAVEHGRIVLEPKSRRPRWTLDELLAQCEARCWRRKPIAIGQARRPRAASWIDGAG